MRLGLEAAGVETVWANDIEAAKQAMYVANFGRGEFVLADVRGVTGQDIPDIELATASFPCTDLSLAGNRRGLGSIGSRANKDGESSMFWEFARILGEMGRRRPPVALLENVLGFASSHGGRDIAAAIEELNRLGYSCDVLTIDARHFVPQSRPRLFIVGVKNPPQNLVGERPAWVSGLPRLKGRMHSVPLPQLPNGPTTLDDAVERLPKNRSEWWDAGRVEQFVSSLSRIQRQRLDAMQSGRRKTWRTAYRRTRKGAAVWEIRADSIAGCLRTARGGSSKQALVEGGRGQVKIRWLTPRECARLMGADSFVLADRRDQSLFGFGDAVCVPVVTWLAENYLVPAIEGANKKAPTAA